jgi:hypothetical protein
MCTCIPRLNRNLEILIFTEGEKPEDREKNPCGKVENQQTTQLACSTQAKVQTSDPLAPQQ